MQKQRMNRVGAFLSSVASAIGFGGLGTSRKNNPYKGMIGNTHPDRKPVVRWGKTGNPDGYGRALLSSPRYRSYKIKRNHRARAANGGTLPKKFK